MAANMISLLFHCCSCTKHSNSSAITQIRGPQPFGCWGPVSWRAFFLQIWDGTGCGLCLAWASWMHKWGFTRLRSSVPGSLRTGAILQPSGLGLLTQMVSDPNPAYIEDCKHHEKKIDLAQFLDMSVQSQIHD